MLTTTIPSTGRTIVLLLLSIVLIVLIAGFILIPTSAVAQENTAQMQLWHNLVANGSFEQGLTLWKPSRSNLSVMVVSQDSSNTPSPDGKQMLRVQKNDNQNFSIRQTILGPMQAEETYTLSAWVRTENLTDTGARLQVINDRWAWEGKVALPTGTTGWQRISVPITLPRSPYYQVMLFLPGATRGTVYLDAVQIEKGTQLSSYKETISAAVDMAANLEKLLLQVQERRRVVEKMDAALAAQASIYLNSQEQAVQEALTAVQAVISASDTTVAYELWEALQAMEIAQQVADLSRTIWAGNLVISQHSPWDNAWPIEPQLTAEPVDTLQFQAYAGEQIYASLVLTNFAESTAYLRVQWGQLPTYRPPAQRTQLMQAHATIGTDLLLDPLQPFQPLTLQQIITVREVAPIAATTEGTLVGDALPILNQAQVIAVPSGESREIHLQLDTKQLQPGNYSFTLSFVPTSGEAGYHVGVELEILPLRLAAVEDDQTLWHSPWGLIYANPKAAMAPTVYLMDAIEHGINVFMLSPSIVLPELNADGTFRKPIDWTESDRRFVAIKQAYPGEKPLWVGYYSIASIFQTHAAKAGITYPSAAFDLAFSTWIREWINHLFELGLDYSDFALELRDEPNEPEEQDLLVYTAKLVRAVDPQVRLLVTVNFADLGQLERIKPYTDIWVILDSMLSRPNVAEFLRNTSDEVWLYQCSRRGKTLNPQGYYRIQGWLGYKHALQGWGIYTWLSTNEDPWTLSAEGNNYSLVYTSPTGPIASRRGTAWSRGNDDYKVLRMFALLAARAEALGVPADQIANARESVAKAVEQALAQVDYAVTYEIAPDQLSIFDAAINLVRQQTNELLQLCLQTVLTP